MSTRTSLPIAALAVLALLAGCGVDASGPSWAERDSDSTDVAGGDGLADGGEGAAATGDESDTPPDGTADGTADSGVDLTSGQSSVEGSSSDATSSAPATAPSSVVVIGDSLTESADAEITAALEPLGLEVVVDGASSRRLIDDRGVEPGIAALRNALLFHRPDVFVIALGTNDVASEKAPEQIMADVAQIAALIPPDAPLVWVDTWVSSHQRDSHLANLAIRQALGGRPRTAIVDWWAHGYDEGVIAGDGIHLQEAGKTLFAELIAEAVEPLLGG